MKKLLVILVIILAVFAVSAENGRQKFEVVKLEKPVPAANIRNFVAKKLPAVLNIKNSLLEGKLESSNTISGVSIHRVSWVYGGIPVLGKFSVIREKDGKIINVINSMNDFSLDTKPSMTVEKAAALLAKKQFGDPVKTPDFISELVIVDHNGAYKLAYRLRFRPQNPLDGRFFFVDANTGALLRTGNLIKYAANTAKVFEMNPISTPDPIEVELPWVADDAQGTLTAVEGENGLRKIVAANCPDEGETFEYDAGYQTFQVPRCTVKQLANKDENGDFIYEDWEKGLKYKFDVSDVYPEIALYYHMTKIYKYLAGLGFKEYEQLPNHEKDGCLHPIVGIANFQMMEQSYNGLSLQPLDNAFYSQHDPYFAEMFFGDFEYNKSDALVFGQGSTADFAYDGDVIYHEFGHGVVEGVTGLSYEGHFDEYGFTNEALGLNEGMADVFSFIMTNDPCLAEYVAQGVGQMGGAIELDGKYCLRTTTNQNLVNEDFVGEAHNDGLPLVGAHWEIYQKMLEKGFTRDDFAKLFLSALLLVSNADLGYKEWGKLILEAAASSPASALKDDFEQILTDRGYFNEVRARDITHDAPYLFAGGVGDGRYTASTNSVFIEWDDEDYNNRKEVAPMYVQFYYDVPECVDTLTVSGSVQTDSYSRNNPNFMVLVREDNPVIWDNEEYPSVVKYDRVVEGKNGEGKSWTFDNLKPGKRYYLHFVNTSASGYLYGIRIKTSWSSEEDCTAKDPDGEGKSDDGKESSDGSEDKNKKESGDSEKNSGGGCSMTLF